MTNSEEPVQKLAERFEKQVIDWLKDLGFKNVDGGRNFRVGGIQVDACGGHEDTLLVFECLMATKRSKQSVRRKIQTLRGSMPILNKALHKHSIYSKYTKPKYILLTKNIAHNEGDYKFAQEKPEISIWDEQLMDYYMKLSKIIGTHARYNLLGEIGVQPRVTSTIRIPALQTRVENHILYLFFVEPQKLIQASYVARREEGKERYYQRILNPKRIGKIRRFINKGGMFPNNIIVAFNKRPKFVPFRDISSQLEEAKGKVQLGILNFPSNYRSCWIIDGQHRLYSFPEPLKGDKVAVAAFEKIEHERQAQFFIEINREQQPVDPNLLWDLEGEMRPNDEAGTISNVVKKMNSLSPFNGGIYIPLEGKRRKGQLKFSGLCTSIQKRKLVRENTETGGSQKNPLYNTDAERRATSVSKALSAFFREIDIQFSEAEKSEIVFRNGGISVMIIIFERILSRVGKIPSEEDLNEYVQALHSAVATQFPSSAERKEFRSRANSEGGRTDLAQTLCLSIRDYLGDRQFGGLIPRKDIETRLKEFERRFASFVLKALEAQSLEALRQYVPQDMFGKTKKKIIAENAKGVYRDLCEQFTIGECGTIVEYDDNWNLFKLLLIENASGFGSRTEFHVAIQAVTDLRNTTMHRKTPFGKYRESELAEIYLDKLEKCVEESQSVI